MTVKGAVQPQSTALKNAIRWLSETTQERPDRSRQELIREAVLRFDLTPRESLFLEENFTDGRQESVA